MHKILISILIFFQAHTLVAEVEEVAEDYAATLKLLVGTDSGKDAAILLSKLDDPVDFALSLTVGQIMLMPPATQQVFMRSIPFYVLRLLFMRDDLNLRSNLADIDYTNSKSLVLVENYLLAALNDAIEDMQMASESTWDSQVMSFRGRQIREKYEFYKGNLLTRKLGNIINIFVVLNHSKLPVTKRFFNGVKQLINAVTSQEILSVFEDPQAVNVYPAFAENYMAFTYAITLFAYNHNLDDLQYQELRMIIKQKIGAALQHMLTFADGYTDNPDVVHLNFNDDRKFDSDEEEVEWSRIIESLQHEHSYSDQDEPYSEDTVTDTKRLKLDKYLNDDMLDAYHALDNLNKEIKGAWSHQSYLSWSERFQPMIAANVLEASSSEVDNTSDMLAFLSGLSLNDYRDPKKMIFDTTELAKISIFKSSDGSENVYYPKDLDQAAEDYMDASAVMVGHSFKELASFKSLLQVGLAQDFITQGAFVNQASHPSLTFYAAAFESNGVDWYQDQSDRVQMFSGWGVYLQPEVYKKQSMLLIENDQQWEASKAKAKKLSSNSGVSAERVPLSHIVTAVSNVIKADNPAGIYLKGRSPLTSRDNGLLLQDKQNCLSAFQKLNNLGMD